MPTPPAFSNRKLVKVAKYLLGRANSGAVGFWLARKLHLTKVVLSKKYLFYSLALYSIRNLSFRMAQCHAKMKRFSDAVAALNRSVEALEANAAVDAKVKAQFSKQLRQCADKMRGKKDHRPQEDREAGEAQRIDNLLGVVPSVRIYIQYF